MGIREDYRDWDTDSIIRQACDIAEERGELADYRDLPSLLKRAQRDYQACEDLFKRAQAGEDVREDALAHLAQSVGEPVESSTDREAEFNLAVSLGLTEDEAAEGIGWE